MIPKNITEQHILKALADIDVNGIKYPLTKSKRYDLAYNGRTYPPKYTISIANEFANGKYLSHLEFNTYEAQNFLKSLSPNFTIKDRGETESLHDLIEKYKKHTRENELQGEVYKWQLVQKFKGRPNLNAPDFLQEIKSIAYGNLIYPVGLGVVHHLAKDRPEQYIACFKNLFDESIPLIDRVKKFNTDTLKLYRELVPEEKFSHHQDERTMATFLTFFNPDQYVFYKDSFYQKYCKLIGEKAKSKGEKYVHYLELIDNFISEYIETDKELIELVNSMLPVDAFKDDEHKILAQDILYTMLDKGMEEIDLEGASVFKISMGTFNAEDLEECIKESKVLVHRDTKSKGLSQEKQSEIFESNIDVGDYFYLTHGNRVDCVKLIGRFTSASQPSTLHDYADLGWLERSFEFVKGSKNKAKYTGVNKWWTPNNNSTCIEIKSEELNEANKVLFEPYFKTKFIAGTNENNIQAPVTIKANSIAHNQILFGPPGTGKTFNSINKAIAIVNPQFALNQSREKIKQEFDRLTNEKQIAFATFHQSMSYEDFIEGIKPDLENGEGEKLEYVMKAGIFKKICAYASYYCYLKSKQVAPQDYKYFFDELYDAFLEDVEEKLEKNNSPVFKTLRGREVTIKKINSNSSIIASAKDSKAKNVAPLTKENIQKLYDKFKSIDEISDLKQVQEAVEITPRITEFYAVFSGLKAFEKTFKPDELRDEVNSESSLDESDILKKFSAGVFRDAVVKYGRESKPVVLIIDEINRGNVSQIFGELITLIEADKRLGNSEELEVTLPYSKEKFGVPSNVYIIGTMNTADRSVEALDTALRRRFSFEEIPPSYSVPNLDYQVSGIDGTEILKTINTRIEKLLDKDHQIGHSYFMYREKENAVECLMQSFSRGILPLLQEYFYGDFGKIGLVLGKGFVSKQVWSENTVSFADFDHESANTFEEREVYGLTCPSSTAEFEEAISLLMNRKGE